MHRIFAVFGLLVAACSLTAAAAADGIHVVPGSFEPGRGPDGNSVFIEAPEGLILVDTGRHPEHRDKLLVFAREAGQPIAAILNTHWHLDHSTGNGDLLAAFPRARVWATPAVDGALITFLEDNRRSAAEQLAAGQVPPEREAEVRRFLGVMDDPRPLRPERPVTATERVAVAGRPLVLNVARFAATEADLWIHDEASRTVIVGDLVVAEVPFMDTACPEGWRSALATIAATDFDRLVPGHGPVMDRTAFLAWKTAFDRLLDCAASERAKDECVSGWRRDAARFIGEDRASLIDRMVGYYIDTRLRAAPAERTRYCRPLRAASH